MRRSSVGLALLGALAAATGASAQTQTQPGTAPPAVSGSGAVRSDAGRSPLVEASALEAGANSFTEGQARSRFEDAGFTAVQDLRKDDAGFWRGRATRGGAMMDVALDFRGRIASGPGVAQLGGATAPRTTTGARPDGTPGNPPSTMTGRAVDRMQGQTPQPDGTPGNPPGTAAGRAVDRAIGTPTAPPATPPAATPPTR